MRPLIRELFRLLNEKVNFKIGELEALQAHLPSQTNFVDQITLAFW